MITLPAYEYLDELSPDELNRLILQEILKDSPDLLLVQGCIQAGAPLETRGLLGRTMLHIAASAGHLEVMKLLLAAGASIDAQDDTAWTALNYAAWGNHPKVVNALLSAGASKDMKDLNGRTSWDYAPNELKSQCPELQP